MRFYLRSKIHNATITEAKVEYIGSITVDKELIEKAGFHKGEKVAVWDIINGERLETYIIEAERNSGVICINGAAAKKVKKGDKVVIAGFELSDKPIEPKIILVGENNIFLRYI